MLKPLTVVARTEAIETETRGRRWVGGWRCESRPRSQVSRREEPEWTRGPWSGSEGMAGAWWMRCEGGRGRGGFRSGCEGGGLWSFQGVGRAFCFLQLPAQTPEGYSAPRTPVQAQSAASVPVPSKLGAVPHISSCPLTFQLTLHTYQCHSLALPVLGVHTPQFPPPAPVDVLPLQWRVTQPRVSARRRTQLQ